MSLAVHTELPWGTRAAGDEERGRDAAPAAPARALLVRLRLGAQSASCSSGPLPWGSLLRSEFQRRFWSAEALQRQEPGAAHRFRETRLSVILAVACPVPSLHGKQSIRPPRFHSARLILKIG